MPGFGPISGLPVGSVPSSSASIGFTLTYPCTGKSSRLMNRRIRTKRKVLVRSATNASLKPRWVDYLDGVCAALQVDGESESTLQGREAGETRLRLYTPSGVDIIETDRVVPVTGLYADKEFEVVSTQADDAGEEAYGKWRLRRVEGGGMQ